MRDRPQNGSPDSREAKVTRDRPRVRRRAAPGDEVAAELVIREALEARLSAAEIDDEIIAPALWFVGELWERGEISVADEHIATEISIRVLALEREAQRVASARGGLRVMLAAPEGEQHVVALKMTGSLLRDAGYEVVMVGADVPADALAVSARRHEPDVVCLTATMPGGEDQALIAIHEVQQQLAVHGLRDRWPGLTSRSLSRPGVEVCRRVSEVVEAVDAVVKRADLN